MKYRKKIIVSVCLLNGFHCEIIGKNDNLHNIFGQVHNIFGNLMIVFVLAILKLNFIFS